MVEQLVDVRSPREFKPGQIDIDAELFKLAHNLKVLTKRIMDCGSLCVELEHKYNKCQLDIGINMSESELATLGIVKSDRFKIAKLKCADEKKALDEMQNKYRYFVNMKDTYQEWVNVYKKTRLGHE